MPLADRVPTFMLIDLLLPYARPLWRRRDLLRTLTIRDALGRYRGSALGLGWSFLHPLLMLAIYAIAFAALLGSQGWQLDSGRRVPHVLAIFTGMTMFNMFAEVFARAPGVVLSQPNYVKKVVFPLEILPVTAVLSAMVHGGISISILFVGQVTIGSGLHATQLLFPVVLVPLLLLCLTTGWFLAALGVYVRDVTLLVGVLAQVLFFATPVIYPMAAVPKEAALRLLLTMNPLVAILESARNTMLDGEAPDWGALLVWTVVLLVTALLSFVAFAKVRRGFADVL